jgi:hypothetical protein
MISTCVHGAPGEDIAELRAALLNGSRILH